MNTIHQAIEPTDLIPEGGYHVDASIYQGPVTNRNCTHVHIIQNDTTESLCYSITVRADVGVGGSTYQG